MEGYLDDSLDGNAHEQIDYEIHGVVKLYDASIRKRYITIPNCINIK